MKLLQTEETLVVAAAKAGMDEKTARKWRDAGGLPSQMKAEHTWRTRPDPFEEVWPSLTPFLETNPGLQAKELFEHLQREDPGRYADGQLRTLQRRVKVWRALDSTPAIDPGVRASASLQSGKESSRPRYGRGPPALMLRRFGRSSTKNELDF